MADIALGGRYDEEERGDGTFLFWWKTKMKADGKIQEGHWKKPTGYSLAFVYREYPRDHISYPDKAECFPSRLLGSITAHNPYWDPPEEGLFTEDELLRIEAMAEEAGTVWDGDAHPVYGPIPSGAA